MSAPFDALELELRRLPGIALASFSDRADTTVVQVFTVGDADVAELRRECERLCDAHVGGPYLLDIEGPRRAARVKLLQVRVSDEDGTPEVEVHLGFERTRVVGRSQATGPVAGAEATLDGLVRLGASIPFRVEAAATFDHTNGDGVMVVLGSAESGDRFGAAAGHGVEQAAARAALHALNRHLGSQELGPAG